MGSLADLSLIYLPGFQIGHKKGLQKSYGVDMSEEAAYPLEAAGWKGLEVKFHGTSVVDSKGFLTIRGKMIATVDHVGQDTYGGSVSDAIQDGFRLVANAPISVPAGVFRSLTQDRDVEGQRTYDDIANEPAEITRSMHRAVIGRRFFRTKEGFIGLDPGRLKVNDLVMLVPGCHVSVTLRASVFVKDRKKVKCEFHLEIEVCLGLGCAKNGVVVAQRYEVIGETFFHGVMNGELYSILESGLQEYVLAETEERLEL